ncbi:hypothetical protein AB0A77_24040 [Streptomyces varsoviensis]|uniref:hypothetical protein n=1 Tax=Streptomyces varsoviensis TaxID=67373 RepID=UPI0033DDFDCA
MGANAAAPLSPLRISRVPSKPVRREEDGRIAIHLWLQCGGEFGGDVTLRLAPADAELLHAQLCYSLDDWPAVEPSAGERLPDCRKKVQGGGDKGGRRRV